MHTVLTFVPGHKKPSAPPKKPNKLLWPTGFKGKKLLLFLKAAVKEADKTTAWRSLPPEHEYLGWIVLTIALSRKQCPYWKHLGRRGLMVPTRSWLVVGDMEVPFPPPPSLLSSPLWNVKSKIPQSLWETLFLSHSWLPVAVTFPIIDPDADGFMNIIYNTTAPIDFSASPFISIHMAFSHALFLWTLGTFASSRSLLQLFL